MKVDAFTFEIIRHRLFQVTEEAMVALENVSGTPITAEGHDLMVALYRADGGLMVGGVGFLYHLTSASRAVKHLLEHYSEDPGIFEDDVYLFNDPYNGALHAPDVYLISPIHWRGRLTGFVADFVHVTDIGAIDAGGFCPNAREFYHEGFATRGLKLVDRGKLRKDVFDTILNLSREPGLVGLDLKSLLAANHVCKQRIKRLYETYGFETVDAVGEELIVQSERLLRERLLQLPDGTWRGREYYDLPGRALPIVVTLTKKKDHLTFDFSGSSAQLSEAVNCSYWATVGSVFSVIFPLLAWDLVWNDGVLKPVTVVAPEGTIVNAKKPAPVSMATIAAVQVARNICVTVISKMLGASQAYRNRATGVWAATSMFYNLTGLSEDGQHIAHFCTDTFAGVAGARAFADGVDMGGVISALVSRWANVERHEGAFPHRYIYRRLVVDSGGPGKFRGGMCHEFAISPHNMPGNKLTAVLMPGRGVESPTGSGIFGGYPGCNTACLQFRGANLDQCPDSLGTTKGKTVEALRWGTTEISADDILYLRYAGGGGYGDPLDRETDLVLKDLLNGLISEAAAHDVYGVIVDPQRKVVDAAATAEQRLALRAQRLGNKTPSQIPNRAAVAHTDRRINEYLQVVHQGEKHAVQCTWCSAILCDAHAQWKTEVVQRKSPLSAAGALRESSDYFLLEFFCPNCGTALDVDTAHKDDPPLFDRIEAWPTFSALK